MDKYAKESIDWDSYKEHIWVWYMIDNKSPSDILKILKRDGVVATKQQLEFRLKKWRIFKTIKSQEARWMGDRLEISRRARQPIIFVKSGKILPETQVVHAIKRHAPPPSLAQKFNTESNAQLQYSPADLIACSPGPPGLYAREIKPWGFDSTLPWIRFRCALLNGSVIIKVRGDAHTSMPPDHLLPITFASRLPSNSGLEVCRFASNLGQVMPEVYTGEHVRRICAIAQAQASLTTDLLEILIFQLSNNFICYKGDFNSQSIVHLMGAFGLDNPNTIRFLFEAAADQPTILAILNQFWRAAYETSSTTLASIIFAEYVRRYDGSDEFGLEIFMPLRIAAGTQNLDLAKVILSGPRSTHVTEALSADGPDLLAHCSGSQNHEFALEMAALLLERHDQLLKMINDSPLYQIRWDTNVHHRASTILRALNRGNIRLARFLVEAGLNPLHYWAPSEFPKVRYKARIFDVYAKGRSIIDHQTIFTAAVVPHVWWNGTTLISARLPCQTEPFPKNQFANQGDSEKAVLENYRGLSEILFEIGKLPEWLRGASSSTQSPDLDVVILAALYGYDALLQIFMHSPSSLNQHNGKGIWPLSAAALGDNESTCRLLVRLGADPNYIPPFGDWLAPLHHAVYHSSTPLVEVLLDLGADINHQSKVCEAIAWCLAGLDEHRGHISALALAIALCHWETAFLLVERGAEIDPLAFDFAVQSDNSSLIDRVLSRELPQHILGRRITKKNGDSFLQIVPENSDAGGCGAQFGPQAQQISYDILSKAASSGNLSLVSRLLKMKNFGSDHHSLQDALTSSLEQGFETISHELILAGANMTHHDLALSFRSCTLTSINGFITNSRGSPFWAVERGLQEFALELAILDNTLDVVQFALKTFPQAYSSGALSAAMIRAAESNFHDPWEPMNELLLRRSNIDAEQLDPILENTAVAIAILFRAPAEVIELSLQISWPGMPALYCFGDWEEETNLCVANYQEFLVKFFIAQRNPQNVGYLRNIHYNQEDLIWCSETQHDYALPILPLTLAIDSRNDQVYGILMAKGFLADRRTVELAIKQCASLDLLEGVLRSCKDGYDIIRLWDDILHFALDWENEQAVHHLIRHGANMSAIDLVSGLGSVEATVLQRAVYECHSTNRHIVQLLLDAGADVNEAPAYRGCTALQAASQNGQLDLARQLVSLGADINARRTPYNGFTCLEAAARCGKLDMTQFLLDAGAKTTGKEQLQYIRAVKLAQKCGHAAVSQILRRHRPWDESDESLFQEEGIMPFFVLHPIEYTVEEIRDLADKICADNHADCKYIWPEIDDHSEADETDLSDDGADDHHSLDVNEVVPPSEDPIVASTSQLAFDVLDDRSSGTYGSLTDPFSSQMVVSNPASDYSMPLHTSFAQLQGDPDFHERIFEMEED